MLSYWEQESFSAYDHIVIGAGIVGLCTAWQLRLAYPAQRILVLERGLLPTGASTRNAGFACMGSTTELLDDLAHTPEDEVVALFAARKQGLELLRSMLGDDAIGYRADGGYELISPREMPAMDQLCRLNEMLRPVTGKPAFVPAKDKIGAFGFGGAYAADLVENTCEGGLHTGMLLRALTDKVLAMGIEIRTGAEVASFEESATHIALHVKDPFRKEEYTFRCATLTICTNAFTPQLLPDAEVIPGRGQVLITHPVQGLRFKGVFHFDKGYYYFREINGRVLFGGGRNLDFEGERTTGFALNDRIQNDLEQKLREIILPHTPFAIDRRWAGIMAFGPAKGPIVRAFSDRLYGAFRMGGMGVALGAEVARQVVALHTGN